jgi:hypothetical protein
LFVRLDEGSPERQAYTQGMQKKVWRAVTLRAHSGLFGV